MEQLRAGVLVTRLVVHIGAQRTASPGFHKSLFDNADTLLQHGVLVPAAGRPDSSPRAVRHQLLAWSFDPDGDHPYDATVWDALHEEIAATSAHTVLLSSELFATVAADPASAPLLRNRLRALSDDVTMVLLVRDQLDLLNSLYCQQVRSLELTCDFDGYLADSPDTHVYDFAASFAPWYAADDVSFVAMPWDPRTDEDTLPALLSLVGISVTPDVLVPGDGEGDLLGPVGIEANRLLGSYLRGRFPGFRPGEPAARKLRRKAAAAGQSHSWDNDEFWAWSPQQAARAAERYATSNQEFARHVLGGNWDLPAPVDRERNVAELVELGPASVNQVHRYLIEMEEAFERLRRREAAA